jgi:hypothetical protein
MPLPERPDLDWLRKQAKHRLEEIQKTNPDAQLADAQFALAKELGFSSFRALKTHIDGSRSTARSLPPRATATSRS